MRWLIAIALIGSLVGCRRGPETPTTPVRMSMWYWHTPFQLSADDRSGLAALGVDTLFVRAATLSFDGDHVVPILPQTFRSAARVHLVYNGDPGLIRHFEEIDPVAFADAIASVVVGDRDRARSAGCDVVGVQLDFDCPTRLLPRYARVTTALRSKIDRKLKLSITGLTSWLASRDVDVLIQPLDFFVPQFYEGDLPKRVDRPTPLGDFARFNRVIDDLGRLAKPIVIGVPSYGQCLLYDGKGDLAGIYRGLSRREAMRHPLLKFDRNEKVGPEVHTFFRAKKDGRDYWLVYRMTPATEVAEFIERLNRARPSNVVEACVYRMPQAGSSMANALPELARALRHQLGAPRIEAKWTVRRSPYAAIERGGDLEFEVSLTVTNRGDAPVDFRPDALSIHLATTDAIEELAPGEFDRVTKANPEESILRSRAFVSTRCALDPGESATLGPIRTRANHLRADVNGAIVEIDAH